MICDWAAEMGQPPARYIVIVYHVIRVTLETAGE
jgi:hypothetical protein